MEAGNLKARNRKVWAISWLRTGRVFVALCCGIGSGVRGVDGGVQGEGCWGAGRGMWMELAFFCQSKSAQGLKDPLG